MEIKITRKQKLLEIGNSWCDYVNFWLIHGRIYSDDGKYYKRFKFIAEVNFSADGWNEEENRNYTEQELMENIIDSYLTHIDSFENCGYFYEMCNNSIERWNKNFSKMCA